MPVLQADLLNKLH